MNTIILTVKHLQWTEKQKKKTKNNLKMKIMC